MKNFKSGIILYVSSPLILEKKWKALQSCPLDGTAEYRKKYQFKSLNLHDLR